MISHDLRDIIIRNVYQGGHPDIIRFISQQGYANDTASCVGAIYGGHMDLLKEKSSWRVVLMFSISMLFI